MIRVWKAKIKVKLIFTYVSIVINSMYFVNKYCAQKTKYFGTLIYYQNLNFVNVEICGKNISKQDMFLLQ